ncbi:hypothetical protein GQ53DRAFT_808174 [Thozetella sp. PMI_491]|nr:hypothetical protein GQ53DRAFT_808174 [Thozetella sp. PMI_491]
MPPRGKSRKKQAGTREARRAATVLSADLQDDGDSSVYGPAGPNLYARRSRRGGLQGQPLTGTRNGVKSGPGPIRNGGSSKATGIDGAKEDSRQRIFTPRPPNLESDSSNEDIVVRYARHGALRVSPYAASRQGNKPSRKSQSSQRQSLARSRDQSDPEGPCINCSTVRRSNQALRDALLHGLERERLVIELWADDVGIGSGYTFDEMDWQHEPTTLVCIRDRRLSSMRNIVMEADTAAAVVSSSAMLRRPASSFFSQCMATRARNAHHHEGFISGGEDIVSRPGRAFAGVAHSDTQKEGSVGLGVRPINIAAPVSLNPSTVAPYLRDPMLVYGRPCDGETGSLEPSTFSRQKNPDGQSILHLDTGRTQSTRVDTTAGQRAFSGTVDVLEDQQWPLRQALVRARIVTEISGQTPGFEAPGHRKQRRPAPGHGRAKTARK